MSSNVERRINIRRFTVQGSSVASVAIEEAEQAVEEAVRRGALVLDEDKEEAIKGIATATENVLIVDPLQGGARP